MVRCSGGAAAGTRRPAGCSARAARNYGRGATARGTSARSCRHRGATGGVYAAAGLRADRRRSQRCRRSRAPLRGHEPGLRTGEWLERWLASRVSLRASTSRGYAAHVRGYLIPYLGGISLAELSSADVQAMFTAIIRGDAALGRPVSAATLRRIHATLRAALNAAVRTGLIAANPGRWPELPAAARPRPQVWTPALTERWEREGWRPVVGVWTARQTALFLAHVHGHRLYALFHLVALRGYAAARPRACGGATLTSTLGRSP
jgi:hypothetical protein